VQTYSAQKTLVMMNEFLFWVNYRFKFSVSVQFIESRVLLSTKKPFMCPDSTPCGRFVTAVGHAHMNF